MAANRTDLLYALFSSALTFRLCYVFINSPLSHIYSDMGRHWDNGHNFLHPELFGSADPLMYQAYLALEQIITRDTAFGIGVCTGLLSAGMPWFWYKALRELLPKNWALAGGIVIAFIPSLLNVYSYFMQETLLITLMAAAMWLSLRSLRLGTMGSYAWAAAVWILACFTRTQALPMACVLLGLLCLKTPRQLIRRVVLMVVFFCLLLWPACWHSRIQLNYCAPFGLSYLNQIYRLSQKQVFTMDSPSVGGWIFGSPNFFDFPLRPLTDWNSERRDKVHITIDFKHGRADWESELERIRKEPKPLGYFRDWAENVVFLFFDPTWPDSDTGYTMGRMSNKSRWLTLPMTLFVLFYTTRYRNMPWRRLLIPSLALMLMLMLLMQMRFINEGRYRKPVDPLLIASCVILLHERWRRRTA